MEKLSTITFMRLCKSKSETLKKVEVPFSILLPVFDLPAVLK